MIVMHSRNESIKSMKHGIWVTKQFVRIGERGGKNDLQFSSLNTEIATANYGKKPEKSNCLWRERMWHMLQIPLFKDTKYVSKEQY